MEEFYRNLIIAMIAIKYDEEGIEGAIKQFNKYIKDKTKETADSYQELMSNITYRIDILLDVLKLKKIYKDQKGILVIKEEIEKELAKLESITELKYNDGDENE